MNALKNFVTAKPTLWFLFLFNLVAAAIIPFVNSGSQGVAASIGMGAVAIKAGIGLVITSRKRRARVSGTALAA
ncbi:hypothetical protein ACFRAO_29925 [Streptomyces sp. NPDC056656]|uniref:hypothetical protein n=1 Tax=Streptomyces sp. NPDC056656 TaxID=3345895 RepID=UPI0036C777DF